MMAKIILTMISVMDEKPMLINTKTPSALFTFSMPWFECLFNASVQ